VREDLLTYCKTKWARKKKCVHRCTKKARIVTARYGLDRCQLRWKCGRKKKK